MAWLSIPGNISCAFKGSDQPYSSISSRLFPAQWKICPEQTRGEHPGKIKTHQEENSLFELCDFRKCFPSPLGIFLPGSTDLLYLITTFTSSTRRFLINCCFPNLINYLCFTSSTEEFPS